MSTPFIDPKSSPPELTLKAIVLCVILAAVLAASNAYVGLKVGWIVSASIPAAVIAMVLFRFTRQTNVLESNIVQTGASASASIAAGIVFVVPALLILGFWQRVNYWETFFICLLGGLFGILFSIPLRRALLQHPDLKFPEGRAIAEVLMVSADTKNLRDILAGSIVGAFIQLCQQGLQIMVSQYPLWLRARNVIYGCNLGFDATMIGAGYLIGFNIGFSIILGAIIGWMIGIPVISSVYGVPSNISNINDFVMSIWSSQIRYIGIGAMLVSTIGSLLLNARPIIESLRIFTPSKQSAAARNKHIPRTERDLPPGLQLIMLTVLMICIGVYFYFLLQTLNLGLSHTSILIYFILMMLYLLIAGFIFSAIAAYFSGLVGMTASPTSAINIAIVITAALLLQCLLNLARSSHSHEIMLNAALITLLVTSVLACAAVMTNGTIQDLKTGEILGASPWKLQTILFIGVAVSTLVIPIIINLLFHAYGIAGVFPHRGMDPSQTLAAPQASLIAAVAQGVFFKTLPLQFIFIGVLIGLLLIIVSHFLKYVGIHLSTVAFCTAIYLPMSATLPLFIGSVFAWMITRGLDRKRAHAATNEWVVSRHQSATLVACGLVAGGSIMGVLISIPVAISGDVNALAIVGPQFKLFALILSLVTTVVLGFWIYVRTVKRVDI